MESIDKVHGTFEKKIAEQKAAVPSAVIKRLPRYHRYHLCETRKIITS